MEGCLILEAASISYCQATSYLPVIELLRRYFQIEGWDDKRRIREKVTGKLLSLDQALEPSLPALLAVLDIPVEAGPASQILNDMIDEADEYCRRGQHLLTLESPADCVAYRRWYLGEVVGQLAGADPVPWPDSESSRSLHSTRG